MSKKQRFYTNQDPRPSTRSSGFWLALLAIVAASTTHAQFVSRPGALAASVEIAPGLPEPGGDCTENVDGPSSRGIVKPFPDGEADFAGTVDILCTVSAGDDESSGVGSIHYVVNYVETYNPDDQTFEGVVVSGSVTLAAGFSGDPASGGLIAYTDTGNFIPFYGLEFMIPDKAAVIITGSISGVTGTGDYSGGIVVGLGGGEGTLPLESILWGSADHIPNEPPRTDFLKVSSLDAGQDILSVIPYGQVKAGERFTGPGGATSSSLTYEFQITFQLGCDIEGDEGNNVLVGTSGPDIICGFGGNDRIRGKGGADIIIGGEGNDIIFGQLGPDIIFGGPGDDTIYGLVGEDEIWAGPGNDIIEGGRQADEIYGEAGTDEIHGEQGHDFLSGGDGDDTMLGGKGNDEMEGGAGHDTMEGENGIDQLFGGEGDDWINGGNNTDILDGNEGRDTLLGRLGDDVLDGGIGRDVLKGGGGNDIIFANDGDGENDRVDGGDGNEDEATVEEDDNVVNVEFTFIFTGEDSEDD